MVSVAYVDESCSDGAVDSEASCCASDMSSGDAGGLDAVSDVAGDCDCGVVCADPLDGVADDVVSWAVGYESVEWTSSESSDVE